MGDDGVDERVGDAEGEVDPEARALGHRAPDDRQRDGAEDDLEEVAGGAGDRGEPGEGRRADGQELVDRWGEAGAAHEPVAAVAEGEAEADEVVDDGGEGEDEDVLRRDMTDVLHPGEARLEEGEAGLHEHDEDGREDTQTVLVAMASSWVGHAASTSSRAGPSGCG